MLPYIVLYSLIILFPIMRVFFKDREKFKTVYCAVVFVTILLILGLRHTSMGMDLPGYLKSFHRLTDLPWGKLFSLESYLNYEKGYIIFNKIVGLLTFQSEQIFLIICALISTIPIWMMIRKKSDDILLSTVIYLGLPIFILQFSGLRQSIAIGICCLAMNFIEQKKLLKFVLMVLFACCFHYTAIVFVLAYFLYHLKIPGQIRWFTLALFPVVYIFRKPIFILLAALFKDNASIKQTNAVTLMFVFAMIYFLIVVLCYGSEDEKLNGYMNIFLFAALCMVFSSVFSTAIRISYYFMLALIILLPAAINRIKDARFKLLLKSIVVVCFILFTFDSIVDTDWAKAYPYYIFWETVV